MGKPHNFNSCSVLLNTKVIISFVLKIKTQIANLDMHVYTWLEGSEKFPPKLG